MASLPRPYSETVPLAIVVLLLLFVVCVPHASAQQTLENPQPDSFQSGVGVISGWACEAQTIEISFNGGPRLQAGAGTIREDTLGVCGDTDNGFGLLYNWNRLGDGPHTVTAYADGVEFAEVIVTVTTLGAEFLRGASRTFPLADFPTPGARRTLRWQQAQQNFVITAGRPYGGGSSGTAPHILENPQPGSFQSGVGVISGWACEAQTIEISFNGGPRLQAGAGTIREDTLGVCGDTDNGFGLLYNWNRLGDGPHTVTAYADGVEFAEVIVTVTTLGAEFLRRLSHEVTIPDFPDVGTDVMLQWQEAQQNFVIARVSEEATTKPAVASVSSASALEGASAAFTVTLASATAQAETYYYSTYTGGSAPAGPGDYAGATEQAVQVGSDSSSFTVQVSTTQDTEVEEAETFYLYVTGAQNHPQATPGSSQYRGTGTIQDDDTVTEPPVTKPPVTKPPVTKPPVTKPPVTKPPVTKPPVTAPAVASVSSASALEGASATFTVTLASATAQAETYYYSTYTGGSAPAGPGDYAGATEQAVQVGSGSSSFTVQVSTTQDTEVEEAETFYLYVTGAQNHPQATPGSSQYRGTGTIQDDDTVTEPPVTEPPVTEPPVTEPPVTTPAVASVSSASALEGASATFTVTLASATAQAETYYYSTYTGGSAPAGPGDYAGATEQAVQVGSGSSSFTVQVSTTQDTEVEEAETFYLYVTGAQNHPQATPGSSQYRGTGTIQDDDANCDEIGDANGAAAGPRMLASGDTNVVLQSIKSLTCRGIGTSFEWSQTSGPTVDLLSADTEYAEFTAPTVTEETTLEFLLNVEYPNGMTLSDTVPIRIVPKTTEKVLSALVDFLDVDAADRPFTREDIVNLLESNTDSLKNFIHHTSRNLVSVKFDILDWITVNKNRTDYPSGSRRAVVADSVSGMSDSTDLSQYDKVLPLIFPLEGGYPGCQAYLVPDTWETPNGDFELGAAWLSGRDMSCVRKGKIAHEYGHTFHLYHSMNLTCRNDPPIPRSTVDPTDMNDSCFSNYCVNDACTETRPGQTYIGIGADRDMLGGSSDWNYEKFFPLHYQAPWQASAGWLTESQVLVPDRSGDYWLTTLESLTPTPKAVKISLGADQKGTLQYYWIQTREFSPSCEAHVRLQAAHVFTHSGSVNEPFRPNTYWSDNWKIRVDEPFWDPHRGIHIEMLECIEEEHGETLELEVTFSPLDIDPPIVVDFVDAEATVTLTNGGTEPIAVGSASIGGRHPTSFVIDSDECSDSSLAASASCEIVLSHVLIDTGDSHPDNHAVLKVPNNDPLAPEKTVSLLKRASP